MEHLKYPIGKFQRPNSFDPARLKEWIMEIRMLPEKLKIILGEMTDVELDQFY